MDYNSPDELLAVVNDRDEEIGARPRGEIHALNLLHRAVHVLVFDGARRLLIQKRSEKKDTWPLHWECVGGHLGPGESYEAAARREVEEELGIRVEAVERLCKIAACDATGLEFIEVYSAVTDSVPNPHPDEVVGLDSLTLGELRAEIDGCDRPFSPTFLNTLRCAGLAP
jgi:isopentenyl-diphosphate delta-isomerase type 1